jgi:hypothetical protein
LLKRDLGGKVVTDFRSLMVISMIEEFVLDKGKRKVIIRQNLFRKYPSSIHRGKVFGK